MSNEAQRLIQYLKTVNNTDEICHAVSCGSDSCIGCPLADEVAFQSAFSSIVDKGDTTDGQS